MGADKEPARPANSPGKGKGGATVNARLRRDKTNSMLHRLRAQAMPHYVLGGLAAGGTVAGWVGPAVTTPGTAGVAVAAAGAAGVWMWARRRGRRALLTGLGAACWCGWTAATGMSWDALAVLAVGGYGAALPWWRRHRLPDPPEHHLPEAPEVDVMDPAHLWEQHVGCTGGPLPGTYLSNRQQLRSGVRFDLHLVPGRHTLAKTLGVVGELRTGLRLRRGMDLVIEPHPEADEATVQLTIVQRSPVLTTAQPWPGGTYNLDTGMIAIGPYVDGEGLAHWRLHTPDSLWGGFIAGSIGSGKSRTMEAIALGLAEAGCAIWYADGQDGSSSPFLAEHADWFRHGTGILDMLQAAQRIKRLRQVQNRMNRWAGWRPDQGRPGLVIIIDECHVPMADPQCQAIATELAREGRKVGISLIMASQVATLDAFGGGAGADALRSSVCAGNMLIMRSLTRTTKNVLPGVDVDPTTFPDVPGYAWLIDHSKARRSAPLRAFFLADEEMGPAAAAVQWSAVEPAAAGAAGQLYGRRHQEVDSEEELEALYLELAGGGGLLPSMVSAPPAPPAAIPVPRFPSPPEIRPMEPAPTRAAVLDRPATATAVAAPTAVEAVAELLAAGVTAPGEMQARSGYSETAVRQALRELAQQGRARRVRHGVWEPTPTT